MWSKIIIPSRVNNIGRSIQSSSSFRTSLTRQYASFSSTSIVFDSILKSSTAIAPNYYAKYAQKLRKKCEEEGFESVDQLVESYKEKTVSSHQTSEPVVDEKLASQEPLDNPTNNLPPHVKPLSSILKLDKVQSQSPETIESLWIEYHKTKDCVSAVVPKDVYLDLLKTSKECPLFVLPLLRPAGIETYYLQFQGHQTFFTTLLDYKLHTSEASPHLSLTFYTDLIESHGLVLMRGDVDTDRITTGDAANLVEWLKVFYITGGTEFKDMVRCLNERPTEFEFDKLLEIVKGVQESKAAIGSTAQL